MGVGVRGNTREGMAELRRSQKTVPSTIDIRGYNPDVAMAVKVCTHPQTHPINTTYLTNTTHSIDIPGV